MNPKIVFNFLLVLSVTCSITSKNKLKSETKIYSSLEKVDVRVNSIVPRHQCRRALRNLEVNI